MIRKRLLIPFIVAALQSAASFGAGVATSGNEVAPSGGEVAPSGNEVAPSGGELAPFSGEAAPFTGEVAPSGSETAPSGGELTAPGREIANSPEYFYGRWSLAGKAGCGSGNTDYVLFRDNGTLEVRQAGRVNRIGFWKLVNDSIVANTLTAPMETERSYPFFGESYRYEYISSRIAGADQDAFSVSMGSDLEKEKRTATLTRCP